MDGYAASRGLLSAHPLFRRVQVAGDLRRDRRGDRGVGRADRLVPLEARQRRGRALALAGDHRRLRRRDAAPAGRDVHQVEADRALRRCSARCSRSASWASAATCIALPDEGHRAAGRRLDARHLVVGRVLRVHGAWPTGTSRSTTRPTPGSISRSGAASACSSCSRWRRACCCRATWPRSRDDRRDRDAAEHAARRGSRRSRRRCSRSTTTAPTHVGHAGAAGGGGHFSLLIVSKHFSGLPRLARHQRGAARSRATCCPIRCTRCRSRALAPDEFPS